LAFVVVILTPRLAGRHRQGRFNITGDLLARLIHANQRMPNGDILLAHSAGYWHASFASPRQFHPI
jgi:hypothetical protein